MLNMVLYVDLRTGECTQEEMTAFWVEDTKKRPYYQILQINVLEESNHA